MNIEAIKVVIQNKAAHVHHYQQAGTNWVDKGVADYNEGNI